MSTRIKDLTDAEIIARFKADTVKRQVYAVRRRIKMELLVKKAEAANITVSEKEVDAELKTRDTVIN